MELAIFGDLLYLGLSCSFWVFGVCSNFVVLCWGLIVYDFLILTLACLLLVFGFWLGWIFGIVVVGFWRLVVWVVSLLGCILRIRVWF